MIQALELSLPFQEADFLQANAELIQVSHHPHFPTITSYSMSIETHTLNATPPLLTHSIRPPLSLWLGCQRQLGLEFVEVYSTSDSDALGKAGGDGARVGAATPGKDV